MPSFAYAETLPLQELVSTRQVFPALARAGVGLVAAVRPWDMHIAPRLWHAAREVGVALRVWPMIEDEHGRWLSVHNVGRFRAMVGALDELLTATLPASERVDLLLDLEMPHDRMQAWSVLPMRAVCTDVARHALAWRKIAPAPEDDAWLAGLRDTRAVDVAVPPMLAWDDPDRSGWSRVMGLPRLAFASTVSPMAYTTLLAGYSRGVIHRARAKRMLAAIAHETCAQWGTRAALSLGCIGTGALGNEATYKGPDDLREDARIARAAGIETLSIFDLGGMVRRGGADEWLSAFAAGVREGAREHAGRHVPTLVGRAARVVLRGVSRLG